jgi:hypothetical protein
MLQPTKFILNLAGASTGVEASSRFVMPYWLRAKVCFVDYRDVAELSRSRLRRTPSTTGHSGLLHRLRVNSVEIAAPMSDARARFDAGEISPDQWLSTVRLPRRSSSRWAGEMNRHSDQHGVPGGNSPVLRAILPGAARAPDVHQRACQGNAVGLARVQACPPEEKLEGLCLAIGGCRATGRHVVAAMWPTALRVIDGTEVACPRFGGGARIRASRSRSEQPFVRKPLCAALIVACT